ncbi:MULTISPECIES: M48 family metallopeptidase [unclassified Snodgrassella]|uniref:M48 family metallopeptidase n=1 Tax=unclassified Snodgrassella TaxID=2625236 RepID=UPI00158233A2|nr:MULTISPECIES: M48 family metallopeptidase [Snodgrassella]MBI0068265.1 M48 family metallopeptidase [Snodgrassella sp. M0110]MBI0077093.1 M48 family metallopeptidase [Snodgrassella sp. M0118]MBI0079566.1 M48 family metallopeptidase [Snodgrassella sp. M0112]NUF79624.1 M48 family metallopeptidase [Snodgrassella sp. ESL0323]
MAFYLSAQTVYILFLLFFICSICGQLYLSVRQSKAVLAHRSHVPAAFVQSVSLAEHQKAADYTLAKQRLARYEILFQALLLLIFTLGGGLDLLAHLSQKWVQHDIAQGIVLIGLFALVNMILGWPIAWYRSFCLEAKFGFNKMTMVTFIADQLKGSLLAIIVGLPLLYIILWLMRILIAAHWFGGAWWLAVWLVWVSFSLLLMWAFPKWIAPLFNKFEPLKDDALRTRIENLLQRTGFQSDGIFVMDGSRRSGHGNAYFTGLGKHKRIVFFDTLLKDMQISEVEAVLAHELGHFAHKHVFKQMIVTFILALIIFAVLGWLLPQTGFYTGLGVHEVSHAMALLLFMLVLPVFTFPFSPLSSVLSRKNEFEADRFAAKYANADDLIHALTKLYRTNASSLVSDIWYSRFYDSHPGARERIAALQTAVKAD